MLPIGEQKVKKPSPYKEINSEWYWNLLKNYIKPDIGVIDAKIEKEYLLIKESIEDKIFDKIRELEYNEENLPAKTFLKKISKINLYAWEKAYELLSITPQKTI